MIHVGGHQESIGGGQYINEVLKVHSWIFSTLDVYHDSDKCE